jgi:hypothetical protein
MPANVFVVTRLIGTYLEGTSVWRTLRSIAPISRTFSRRRAASSGRAGA